MTRILGGGNQQRVDRPPLMCIDADINLVHYLNAFNIGLAGNYWVRNTRHIELILVLSIFGYSVSVPIYGVQVRKNGPQKALVVGIRDIHKTQFRIA